MNSLSLIKAMIIMEYNTFCDLRKNDNTLVTLEKDIKQTSDQIAQEFIKFKHGQGSQDELNRLTALANQLKEKRETYLQSKLKLLHQHWPDLFQLFINSDHLINRDTLEDVLNTYLKVLQGQMTTDEALDHGKSYMTSKYNLPPDAFKKS